MTGKKAVTNPPAFARPCGDTGPCDEPRYNHAQSGMSLRDYFAAKAMPLAWQQFHNPETVEFHHIAKEAYEMADAMLRARKVSR